MSTLYFRFATRGSPGLQRAPVLEGLIARAALSIRDRDWRDEAFRIIAVDPEPIPAIAPAALHAAVGTTAGAWVCVATPVHWVAGMTGVTMPQDGILQLSSGEAEALAADFNRVFQGAEARLAVGRAATLLCVFDRALEVVASDPEAVLGYDVFSFQPTGTDAPRVRRLMSEIEMWLFDHEVNRAARAPITGLWLWGGGTMLPAMPAVHGWTAGSDPLFAALSSQTDFPGEAGAGVVVCAAQPGSPEWLDVETRWLAPAVAALRSGRVHRLELSTGDRRFSVKRGINRRFWRRPRPWWESLDREDK